MRALCLLAVLLAVAARGQSSDGDPRDAFLRTTLSRDTVYVQQQLIYTVKLYYRVRFERGARFTAPAIDDSAFEKLENEADYTETVNGIRYNVNESQFIIFPQRRGELTVMPAEFSGTVRGDDNIDPAATGRVINLRGESHRVNVVPLPGDFPSRRWLPSPQVTIEERWDPPPATLDVGESAIRTITLSARGLNSSLLLDIEYAEPEGLRFYPRQATRNDTSDANVLTARYTQQVETVAIRPGRIELPPVEVPWWNTVADKLETATLPARTITILPGENLNSPTTESPSGPGGANNLAGTLLFLTLVGGSAVFLMALPVMTVPGMQSRLRQWLHTLADSIAGLRLPRPGAPPMKVRYRELKRACHGKDPAAIREAVVAWGRLFFSRPDILTLGDLARSDIGPEFRGIIIELERCLYGEKPSSGFSNGAELMREVEYLSSKRRRRRTARQDYTLPPLYRN